MRVGFYQFAPVFGDAAGNMARVREALSGLEADLIVLPELFNTGYQFVSEDEARDLAEPIPDGETCAALIHLARERGTHIAAGIAERDGARRSTTPASSSDRRVASGGTESCTCSTKRSAGFSRGRSRPRSSM